MGILGILIEFDHSMAQLGNKSLMLILFAVFSLAPLIACFILQGVGLNTMAKKRNMNKRAWAFVPFANTYFMGKLAGECSFFGQKVKRVGLYAMLAQIISFLLNATVIGIGLYFYVMYGDPDDTSVMGVFYWSQLPASENVIYTIFEMSYWIQQIVYFIFEVLMVMLVMGLYKRYVPENYVLLGLLSFFLPIAKNIIIFVIRKRKAIDYDQYMREKREAFFRRQQEYQRRYGNPYNNPYGNPYQNPYNQNNPKKPDDDPFAEFASDKKSSGNSENTQTTSDENSDGFFD